MKKILMVSFVALLAGVGSGHAAIPSTDYVDQGLETKVDDTQIVPAAGSAGVATYAAGVQAGTGTVQAEGDAIVPSLNTVAQHFIPNIAATAYNMGQIATVENGLPDGSYSLIVDSNGGKITYRWVALQGLSDTDTSARLAD